MKRPALAMRARSVRRAVRLAVCCAAWCLTTGPAVAVVADKVDDDAGRRPTYSAHGPQVDRLVQQLGNDRFAMRERAMSELIGMGVSAIDALRDAQNHNDREIRFRSRRILKIVRNLDFARRLQAFADDPDDVHEHELPGWRSFRSMIGEDPTARALFVSMQKAEPRVLEAIEDGPKETSETLVRRCAELNQTMRIQQQQLDLGTVATVLFAATQPEVSVTTQCSSYLYSFCYQPSFQNAMQGGENQELMRKILGIWIEQGENWNAYQGLLLAMRYDLSQGLKPAIEVLKAANNPVHVRQYAVLTIAKLGDRSHVPLLEPLLTDKTRCMVQRINNVEYETQLRDVVLASLLHLTERDLAGFGFDRARANTQIVFSVNTLGFQNEELRRKALQKWEDARVARLPQ